MKLKDLDTTKSYKVKLNDDSIVTIWYGLSKSWSYMDNKGYLYVIPEYMIEMYLTKEKNPEYYL